MDTNTGQLYDLSEKDMTHQFGEHFKDQFGEHFKDHFEEVDGGVLTSKQFKTKKVHLPDHDTITKAIRQRAIGKIGRNELCPCGSGLKYKKCCLV